MGKFLAVFLAVFSLSAQSDIVVKEASIRVLPPGVPNTSAYFTLTNKGNESVFLTGGETPVATTVELHNHIQQGDMMRMEKQEYVEIPADQTVSFAPGGLHLMVFGLTTSLEAGQSVPISLSTRSGESITFTATAVRPGHEAHHGHH